MIIVGPEGAVRKTVFLSHSYINVTFLPSQARDKHRGKEALS
eukprot:COSAG06_NODE_5135_length_3692_cov_3.408016_5_plen_42_part_00